MFDIGAQLEKRRARGDRRVLGGAQLHRPGGRGGVPGADPEKRTLQRVSLKPDLITRACAYRFAQPRDLARGLPREGSKDGINRGSIASESPLQ